MPKRKKSLAAILAWSVIRTTKAPRCKRCSTAPAPTPAFYDHFASKGDCFAAAYEEAATALEAEVQAAAGAGEWEAQLCGGLGRLAELLDEDQVTGRALPVEVHPAGERWPPADRERSPFVNHGGDKRGTGGRSGGWGG